MCNELAVELEIFRSIFPLFWGAASSDEDLTA